MKKDNLNRIADALEWRNYWDYWREWQVNGSVSSLSEGTGPPPPPPPPEPPIVGGD